MPFLTTRADAMTLAEQQRLVECLEAPRLLRDERALRAVFRPGAAADAATTESIAALVKERGFEPYAPPETLQPIERDDVTLVVWMAVESMNALNPEAS